MASGIKLLCVTCNIVTESEGDFGHTCPGGCGQTLTPDDNRVPEYADVEIGQVTDSQVAELLNLQ